jgi:hypothetical protein
LAAFGGDGLGSPYQKNESLSPARGQFKVKLFPAAARIEEKNPDQYLKQQLKDKLIEHKQYTDKYGVNTPCHLPVRERIVAFMSYQSVNPY